MKKIVIATAAIICLVSCKNETAKEKNVPQLPSWVLGTWQTENNDSTVFTESWRALNDSVYEGEGLGRTGSDTLFSEKLQIRRERDTIYYVPTVANQNRGNAVRFRFEKIDSSGFTAVNAAHDFPKKIEYTLKNDSIYAVLTGSEGGKERREVFPMKKK